MERAKIALMAVLALLILGTCAGDAPQSRAGATLPLTVNASGR